MKLNNALLVLTLILTIISMTACGGGGGAKDGDTVSVHYTGTLSDGSVFDSSAGKEPLVFVLGQGSMISGFEKAVKGMKPGETKTVTLSPDEAYGEYRKDLVITLDRNEIPAGMNVELGQKIQLKSNRGTVISATVTDIADGSVILNGNHELAGQELTFEIQLVELISGD